jgi:hypothetical protein
VEVEIIEGQRAESLFLGNPWDTEPLPHPELYPRVGASIALSEEHGAKKAGCGTLGGYVQVDGKIMGLTNHYVAFQGVSKLILRPRRHLMASRIPFFNQHSQIWKPESRTWKPESRTSRALTSRTVQMTQVSKFHASPQSWRS